MFRKIKEVIALNKAVDQYEDIKKEVDTMDAKHLLASKTFWMNVLGLAMTIAGILPAKWAGPTFAVANIGMRLVSNQPVTLSIPWKDQS